MLANFFAMFAIFLLTKFAIIANISPYPPRRSPLADLVGMEGTMSAHSMNLTASDLITALRPAPGKPWREIMVNDEYVGTISKTDREHPGMRWYWQAMGYYSYCATEEEAVAEIKEKALKYVAEKRRHDAEDRARAAEIAALPAPLAAIRVELDNAKARLELALMRNVRRAEEIAHWERRVAALETEYAAAERAMAEAA